MQLSYGHRLIIGFANKDLPRIKEYLQKRMIGGVILFSRNIESPSQLRQLTKELRSAAGFNCIIAVDQEGGKVTRLTAAKGFNDFPTAESIGKTMTPQQARELYSKMATELLKHGINLNLAPVADLKVSSDCPVTAKLERSFGHNPDTVITYATAFIQAHKEAGVMTCIKHFPGHGSCSRDSHEGPADISHTWQQTELKPFKALAPLTDMIMPGHL
ncbi:MAG: glycoside hydrolase family 3 protein, partial [Candidatus Cloacimonetes bacterium]|nr:glycoside hydrolase family 3 protein [Candidatus Cloacimonadota bacterium]